MKGGRCLVLAVAFGCVAPTDRSGGLRVELSVPLTVLLKDSLALTPRVVDTSGMVVPLAAVSYESTDPTILQVGADGVLRAVGVGTATLTVRAIGFAEAAPFRQNVRVRGKLEVDSIRPLDVRFGDSLEVFGVGLDPDSIFSIAIGGVDAVHSAFIPEDPDRPEREGLLRIWVPPPAPRRSSMTVLGFGGGLVFPDSVNVLQRDQFEPNDTVPYQLGSLPNEFHNPALALEPRPRVDGTASAPEPADWYAFDNPTTQDRTVAFFSEGGIGQAFGVFISDSLTWSPVLGYVPGPSAWTVGIRTYLCGGLPVTRNGVPIQFAEQLFPLSIIALRALPAGRYYILAPYVSFGAPTRYELSILNRYASVLPPDAAEENDYCNVAAPLPTTAGSFTIDNPHDIDWFRFTVPLARSFAVTLTAADPEADLDLYLIRDFRPDSLVLLEAESESGPSETLTSLLPGGGYFLVVVDFQGQPTPYTLNPTATAAGLAAGGGRDRAAELDAALARLRDKAAAAGRDPPALLPPYRPTALPPYRRSPR